MLARSGRLAVLLPLAIAAASCAGDSGAPDGAAAVVHPDQARAPGVVKVVVPAGASSAAAPAGAATVGEVDYGGFRLLFVDEKAAGGRDALDRLGLDLRDDMNRIVLEGWPLDTRRPADVESLLPAAERRDELARARADQRPPRDGLYLVQFVGPVRDAWRATLTQTGLELVSYVPENAYVVRARGRAAAALPDLVAQHPEVQFVGDFHPAYRLASELRPLVARNVSTPVDVTVQIIDGNDAAVQLGELRALALAFQSDQRVLGFRNVALTVDSARLPEIAGKEYVFHVEPRTPLRRLDEVQGQILAGNLTGSAPSGPGYLDWLGSKGFAAGQFGSFAVNVVDDTYTLSGHPDLPADRVAFVNNPTNQSGVLGGHGFLNANIVAGSNSGIGTAVQDALGFHYGLGISPFARVGATAIFGSTPASDGSWEGAGYASGARISTNSWGFIGAHTYDSHAQAYDALVRDSQNDVAGAQPVIIVFSAGNDGAANGTVSTPSTAKNVITVGAGENVRPTGTDGCAIDNTGANSANDVISFSSRGPVNVGGGDGRIKPDLMAPGTHIEAGIPQSNYSGSSVCNQFWPAGQTLYGWSSGTSHSCPAVAGAASLVYQDFLNKGLSAPSPAMAKAYLMNSATSMTGVGANDTLPSVNQGMGRVNLGRAFDGVPRILVDQSERLAASGETRVFTGDVASTTQPFRVTLAWTDAPGSTTGAPWVNNLDLTVRIAGVTFKGNVFSGANSVGGGGFDPKNNVESVFLPAGVSGPFTITVRGTNIAGDGVPGNDDPTDQDFALVVYNAGSTTPTNPVIGVSPAALSFTAVAGGPNPDAQSLAISNSGGGTLSWSAGSNQAWLAVSPSAGTAPSQASVSVDITGLDPGTYNGAISIAGAGATNSPVLVPVSLVITAVPQPAIAVSPTSFTFTATAGGPAPATQALAISNSGAGTLDWSAGADADWLTLSPSAGTAPSTVTVAVSPTGLVAGVYHATITISGVGAANSPVTVPVTLTVSPPQVGDPIVNGGFESGTSPWVLSGTASRSTGAYPHGGSAYAVVGGTTSLVGSIYQTVTIPDVAAPQLSFWLNIATAEAPTAGAFDKLFVEVRSTSGTLLATLATFSNADAGAPGVYTQRGGLDVSAFKGQSVRLQLRATNDSLNATSFRIDDVSVR